MKQPWFRIAAAAAFGSIIALSCVAEAVLFRIILPW
jgi:hypothetical protein